MSNLDLVNGFSFSSGKACLLRSYLIEIIQSGEGFPTKNGKPNVEYLSSRLGISRQSFYAGRSSGEFLNLLQWAVENITHSEFKVGRDSRSYSRFPKDCLDEILKLRKENSRLRLEVEAARRFYSSDVEIFL